MLGAFGIVVGSGASWLKKSFGEGCEKGWFTCDFGVVLVGVPYVHNLMFVSMLHNRRKGAGSIAIGGSSDESRSSSNTWGSKVRGSGSGYVRGHGLLETPSAAQLSTTYYLSFAPLLPLLRAPSPLHIAYLQFSPNNSVPRQNAFPSIIICDDTIRNPRKRIQHRGPRRRPPPRLER